MKFTLSWLRDHLDTTATVPELVDAMTMAGLEVEHVADPLAYLTACQQLLKPGGLMICSTLNRNPKSFVMAIIGAEWVMRWLPKGTHDWAKFITPDELVTLIRNAGLDPVDKKGMVFNPVSWRWALSDRDLSVNYVTASVKR